MGHGDDTPDTTIGHMMFQQRIRPSSNRRKISASGSVLGNLESITGVGPHLPISIRQCTREWTGVADQIARDMIHQCG